MIQKKEEFLGKGKEKRERKNICNRKANRELEARGLGRRRWVRREHVKGRVHTEMLS